MATTHELITRADELATERLEPPFERLRGLHARLPPPRPGDWLAMHPEPGQSFAEYTSSRPIRPTAVNARIYVQPIGDFSAGQRRILDATIDWLGRFFALQVASLPAIPLERIPAHARRTHPSWGMPQLLSRWMLDELLVPLRQPDALATLALTANDLWPGEGWNFVFGEASLRERVGVWSFYRNGDADAQPELCLLRTIKTAAHETAHMLSIAHCIAYRCLMNGSNHQEERDRRPVALCPPDLQKLCWNLGLEPAEHHGTLARFCSEHGLHEEARFFTAALERLA